MARALSLTLLREVLMVNFFEQYHFCPFCLQQGLLVKFDKKNRPYAVCERCSSRVFIRSLMHLGSLYYWSDVIGRMPKSQREAVLTTAEANVLELVKIAVIPREALVKERLKTKLERRQNV